MFVCGGPCLLLFGFVVWVGCVIDCVGLVCVRVGVRFGKFGLGWCVWLFLVDCRFGLIGLVCLCGLIIWSLGL